MKLSDEYRLAEYEELKYIHGRNNISIVRNKLNGMIAIKKILSIELKEIYLFLKDHPSPFIPTIFECIENNNQLIIIEEYLTGQNLEEILFTRNIPEKEAVSIILQLCHALKPLHNATPPIICRDLKASNIMITLTNDIKIIDFDIARTYRPGQSCDTELMGTKEYAAPEQYGFRQTDARTDIYAIGVLLNYLILKKFPVEEIVSGKLKKVVCKCLEMNPNDRYQNVDDLRIQLELLYDDLKNSNIQPDTPEQITPPLNESYIPPGFRTRTWWKMLTAILGYTFVTMLAFSMEFTFDGVKLTGIRLRFEQSIIWLTQIALIFLIWNYRGIRETIPLVKDSRRIIRIIGYIIAEFILLFIGILFIAMFESFTF